MSYKTTNIIVTGNKVAFEKESDKLNRAGFFANGSINVTVFNNALVFSQLLIKFEPID